MDEQEKFVKTTIYLQRRLLNSAKIMGVLTGTNVSFITRIALAEKIKKLKEEFKEKENSNLS